MDAKNYLIETLEYYKQRVINNSCTMEEINSAAKTLQESMTVYGRIDDLAEFYGKSKEAVNGQIKRKMLAKPKKNITLYSFHAFQRLIPDSWRGKG